MSKIMIKIMIRFQDNDVVHLPPQNLTLQSDPITHLASDLSRAHQKNDYTVHTVVSGLHHLPPRMKNQHGLNEEKNLNT